MKNLNYKMVNSALVGGLLFLFSCTNNPEQIVPLNNSKVVAEHLAGPFPFYKNIVIRPGLNFEVVSWGKGVDSIGGYLILMSDSTKNKFKSLSDERNGIVTDAWNMDLDNDGNPEIYVQLKSKTNVLDLNVFEYAGGGFNKISFPGLSNSLKKNYAGNDEFTIKSGDLFRSFPVINPSDSTIKPDSIKTIQYRLSGNTFSSSEVKE
ncbi:hypothetical protein LPB86_20620 [Pedobacter sp. MC2016-14]|uniref:hypothetical protein n=1 Tax=Pedobacter sp. MC2016-14 TaxID=2897327 RepID=UPI001E32AE78|nr:hypothetical protein [Pedobacter sp. MC2016-14]MCD0490654.1 hypothetical protein [Pedobacter sp. MC2016-14]